MSDTLHRTDRDLKSSLEQELRWSPDVKADRIGVSVTDGAVTLAGEVPTYPEKDAAVAAAFRVKGVTAVANTIVVMHLGGRREDVDIAREAARALESTVTIPPGSVKAAVDHGRITLTGLVAWNYQREAARRAVKDLPGVLSVSSDVVLEPDLPFAAGQARTHIREALVRNAETDASTITVSVQGTQIVLTGTVHSWSEFRQAANTAWGTPGVTGVLNRLTVVA